MAYATGILAGKYLHPDGTPAEGRIEIIPSVPRILDAAGNQILAGRVKPELDQNGAFSVTLPATDDLTLNPSGVTYTVAARLHHTNLAAVVGIAVGTGATVQMSDVDPGDPDAPVYASQVTAADFAALAARVTTLEAGGGGGGGGGQPLDSDLTAIAGLTPTNDDLIQRKAGAWTNRTPAQVKTDLTLVKGDVGLGSVDNTADTAKPVSTAQAAADSAVAAAAASDATTKANAAQAASQPLDSDLTAFAAKTAPSGAVVGTTDAQTLTNKTLTAPAITSPTGLAKGDVGLGNVTNTSDANKPVSTAQAAADALALAKASNLSDLANAGTARTNIGLGNVDNTSDVNKPVSTAQAAADTLKKTDSMSTNKLLGRGTASTGAIEEITLGTNLSLSGTTLNAAGGGGGTVSPLTRTAVKTGNYTAALWDLVPADTSGGAFTVTLPAASGGKGRLAIKIVTAGNTLNLALTGADTFNTSGGPTTGSISLANQAIILESDGTSIWTTTADDIPLTALDARYVGVSSRAKVADEAHADTTIVNTTTETDAVSLTLPAGAVAAGDLVQLSVWCDQINNSGATVTYTYRLKFGATTVLATPAINAITAVTRAKNIITFECLVESTTAQRWRAALTGARGTDNWATTALQPTVPAIGYGTSAEDTSSSKTLKLTVQMGTANASADFVCHAAALEIVKKV